MNFFRSSKKLMTVFLSAIMLSAAVPGQFANAQEPASVIRDIDGSNEYAKASILSLAGKNIISGDNNGYFHPLNTITRAEMAKLIVKALGIDTAGLPETPTFSDVPKDHWAFEYVEAGYRAGIFKGISKGVFGLNNECTREEMATLFVRATGLKDEDLKGKQPYLYLNRMTDRDTVSDWAKENMEFALSAGLMKGVAAATIGAKNPAQRQQAAVLIDRFINEKETVGKFTDTFKGEVNYPELYQALQNIDKKFKGNIEVGYQIDISDEDGDSISNIDISADGLMDMDTDSNVMNMDMDYNLVVNTMGEVAANMQFRVIALNGNYYLQYDGIDGWQALSKQDIEQLGMEAITGSNASELLKYYRYATVSKQTGVDFRGRQTVKYTVALNAAAMEAIMTGAVNGEAGALGDVPEFDADDLKGTIEIYLDENGRMVYQNIVFAGTVRDEAIQSDVTAKVILNSFFEPNEGIVIAAPALELPGEDGVEG